MRNVEGAEARRAARRAEKVIARRSTRILALPPLIDRFLVASNSRRELLKTIRCVARNGVDEVDLEGARHVRLVNRPRICSAPLSSRGGSDSRRSNKQRGYPGENHDCCADR